MTTTISASEWEAAWGEYTEALDSWNSDWSGEGFPESICRVKRRLDDAKADLRRLDPDFCGRMGIN